MSGDDRERRCSATTSDGSPCGAPPQFVDPATGYCPSHDPAKREAIREAAQRGTEAAKAKREAGRAPEDAAPEAEELTEDELEPLASQGTRKSASA